MALYGNQKLYWTGQNDLFFRKGVSLKLIES